MPRPRARLLLVPLLVAGLGWGPALAAPTAQLDQHQEIVSANPPPATGPMVFGFGVRPGSTPRSVAQTFVAGVSGRLTAIEAPLGYSSNEIPSASIAVTLRSVDSFGRPTENVLATTSVPINGLPRLRADVWARATFAAPATVQAGTRYALAMMVVPAEGLTSPDQATWGFVVPSEPTGDVYPNGAVFLKQPDTWAMVTAGGLRPDNAFRTFVEPAYAVEGFGAPVDRDAVNVAQAGRTIPLTWRLTDRDGAPVSDPASFAGVTSSGGACDSSDPTDAVETYAGGSGLQYLGDGRWQLNWKTLKTYAKQCRTVTVTLDSGQTVSAEFSFK